MASDRNRTSALLDRLQRISRLSSNAKPEVVHQLRTTIRRLETLLLTDSPVPGRKERKLLKRLARLRRRAGKVRDLDVQIEALASLRLESSARDRASLMAFLEKERARRKKKFLAALEAEVDDGLHRRLRLISARFRRESPKIPPGEEKRSLTAALDKFAAAVKQRPTLSESNLHNFRMDCKRVRYVAEMAGKSPETAAVIEPLTQIQNAIGVWHDWLTLTATAESVLSRSGQVPLLSALRANVRSRYFEALRVTAEARKTLLAKHETAAKGAQLATREPFAVSSSVAAMAAARAATA